MVAATAPYAATLTISRLAPGGPTNAAPDGAACIRFLGWRVRLLANIFAPAYAERGG